MLLGGVVAAFIVPTLGACVAGTGTVLYLISTLAKLLDQSSLATKNSIYLEKCMKEIQSLLNKLEMSEFNISLEFNKSPENIILKIMKAEDKASKWVDHSIDAFIQLNQYLHWAFTICAAGGAAGEKGNNYSMDKNAAKSAYKFDESIKGHLIRDGFGRTDEVLSKDTAVELPMFALGDMIYAEISRSSWMKNELTHNLVRKKMNLLNKFLRYMASYLRFTEV